MIQPQRFMDIIYHSTNGASQTQRDILHIESIYDSDDWSNQYHIKYGLINIQVLQHFIIINS